MTPSKPPPLRPLLFALYGAASLVLAPSILAQKPDVRAKVVAPSRLAAGSKATLAVEVAIGPDWHVNSHTPSETFLIPTDLVLAASAGTLSPVRYPKDVEKRFAFSDKPLRVYAGTVRFETDLELPPGASGKVKVGGNLSYQACNDRQCYAPAKIPLEASLDISAK
ncbi:MAG: protein-disulfide reductase DsbD domain-containing protein [Acidobacteriota bacterium]